MKYCSECGAQVVKKTPPGDTSPRFICESCKTIHYQNPKIIAGCMPVWEDKILLCRRAIEPRYGLWTLPAGFMENGESVEQAALRETFEEANAKVALESLLTMVSIVYISQVYLIFKGRLLDMSFSPGPESLEVALFSEHETPWRELAFPVVQYALTHYFEDIASNSRKIHIGNIQRGLPYQSWSLETVCNKKF